MASTRVGGRARRAFIDGVPRAEDLSRGTDMSLWTIWRPCFQNAFLGSGTQLVVSAALSQRRGLFRTAHG